MINGRTMAGSLIKSPEQEQQQQKNNPETVKITLVCIKSCPVVKRVSVRRRRSQCLEEGEENIPVGSLLVGVPGISSAVHSNETGSALA